MYDRPYSTVVSSLSLSLSFSFYFLFIHFVTIDLHYEYARMAESSARDRAAEYTRALTSAGEKGDTQELCRILDTGTRIFGLFFTSCVRHIASCVTSCCHKRERERETCA